MYMNHYKLFVTLLFFLCAHNCWLKKYVARPLNRHEPMSISWSHTYTHQHMFILCMYTISFAFAINTVSYLAPSRFIFQLNIDFFCFKNEKQTETNKDDLHAHRHTSSCISLYMFIFWQLEMSFTVAEFIGQSDVIRKREKNFVKNAF